MGRQRGGFSSLLNKAKEECAEAFSRVDSQSFQAPEIATSPILVVGPAHQAPELSVEELKTLLESLRTVCVSPEFQKELTRLRERGLGAFQKRQSFARILGAAWKEPMRAAGYRIDCGAFPAFVHAVRSQASQAGIRTLSEEVERQLKFIPGAFFGANAGAMKGASPRRRDRGVFSRAIAEPQSPLGQGTFSASASSSAPAFKASRGRELSLGEAKDLLTAMAAVAGREEHQRTIQKVQSGGGRQLPALISSLLNPTMRRFDYPVTKQGYDDMVHEVGKYGWNHQLRAQVHALERLFMMPPGAWFQIPAGEVPQGWSPTLQVGSHARGLQQAMRPETFQQRRDELTRSDQEDDLAFQADPVELDCTLPPKESQEVELIVKHALGPEGGRVALMVSSTSTVLDLRKVVAEKLGEDDLSQIKIVQKLGSHFQAMSDSAKIGEKRAVLCMGRSLIPS